MLSEKANETLNILKKGITDPLVLGLIGTFFILGYKLAKQDKEK